MFLAQVQGFLEVARLGNVTRAAQALFLTQPALTARLKALEAELGEPLFVRTGRGVRLSEAGRTFLPHAQRAVDALKEGRELLAEIRRGSAGELTLGAAPAVSTYVLPSVLKRLASRHPQLRLVVRTGHSEEVLEMVLRGDVQLGLVRAMRHPEIENLPLYEDELVLVSNPAHWAASRPAVRVEDIGRERLVLFDRTSSYHDLTNAFFRQAGVVPSQVMELDNIDAAKKMVEQGLGIAFLPHTAVASELAAGTLRLVHLARVTPPRRSIVAVRRRDAGPPSVAVASFLECFAEVKERITGFEEAIRSGVGAEAS